MNERIKDLAIKARLSYVMTPDKPYIEEDLEKFAKLIVLDAIKDCRDMFIVNSVSWNVLNDKLLDVYFN